MLDPCATFGTALLHPVRGQPGACLLRPSVNDSAVVTGSRGVANDREWSIERSGLCGFFGGGFRCLRAITRLIHVWGIGDTGAVVHLDDAIVGQFLDTTHVPCLNGQLIFGATIAFGPFGDLPVRGTRLGIALQLTLVNHWLVQIDTLLGRRDLSGSLTNTFDNGRLNSAATGLGAGRELDYLPRELASPDLSRGAGIGLQGG